MNYSFFDFFIDPILRGPTWGSIFMCIASSLMGVLVFLRKKSLLSESLSHATYPGAVIGVSLFAQFLPQFEEWTSVAVLAGAFFSSWLALQAIGWLERKGKVRSDSALSFVLATFFGAGVVAASAMQAKIPSWYKQIQMLLFGQAATMSDLHIVLYGSLALIVAFFLFLSFRPLQASLFDPEFSLSAGIRVSSVERIFFWLLLLSLIVGIRSVGIVLMSGMVVAPAVAARQFSDRLQTIFWAAAFFGALSALLGNYFSVWGSIAFSEPDERFTFPTGPMIVLVGTFFALASLLLAPKRGLVFRIVRILSFRLRCLEENILKGIWKKESLSLIELKEAHQISPFFLRVVLWRIKKGGWVVSMNQRFHLSRDGLQKAASIVRLHRLWELYLAETLGLHLEKVHRTAEEMEHILTPEIEERLTRLFGDPKHDPHSQPIPERALKNGRLL